MSKEIEQWITVNGNRVPIMKGQSKADAVKSFVGKQSKTKTVSDKTVDKKTATKQSDDQKSIAKNEDEKDQQIARNQKEADNAKQSENTTKALQTVNPASFNKSLVTAKESRPIADKWRVDDTHTIEDYKARGCACYVSKGGSTVAVDRNGDIISLCKNTNDKMKGRELMAEAVKLGGRKLDSFDGNHEFYVSCGFEPVSYTKFNEKYAPKGWKESGCGREDVVFYRYVGIGKVKNTDLEEFKNNNKPFTGENGYDDAMKYRDKFIK